MSDTDIWRILAYLKTLAAPAPAEAPRGNAGAGENLFVTNCLGCHRVGDRGGHLGPDLSRIGVARARAALARQIRGNVADFRTGYEPVTLTTPGGQQIRGVKKNEDLFSVQIMDSASAFRDISAKTCGRSPDEKQSAMPVFGSDRLTDAQLDDLLAYLETLQGAVRDPDGRQSIGGLAMSRRRSSGRFAVRGARGRGPGGHSWRAGRPPALVSSQELLDGLPADGSRWLTFGGSYTNQRHSPLTQITPENVARLVPQWMFQTDTPGSRFETTPLLRDNVLYVTGPLNSRGRSTPARAARSGATSASCRRPAASRRAAASSTRGSACSATACS